MTSPYDPYSDATPPPYDEQHPAAYAADFAAVPQIPEPPLVVIGDITCTQSQVITPSGTFPIAGSQWAVTDMSMTTERMSQTGLVLALVGFFLVCFLSLLFLLMKDRQTTGYVQVTVRGGGITHVCNIPAFNPGVMGDVSSRVAYARTLAGMA